VPEVEVLVGELLAVDRLGTGAVTAGEVTAPDHEAGDDPTAWAARVAERLAALAGALLAGAEGAEVLGGLRHDVGEELKGDRARGLGA
jgi:hypothetical protein